MTRTAGLVYLVIEGCGNILKTCRGNSDQVTDVISERLDLGIDGLNLIHNFFPCRADVIEVAILQSFRVVALLVATAVIICSINSFLVDIQDCFEVYMTSSFLVEDVTGLEVKPGSKTNVLVKEFFVLIKRKTVGVNCHDRIKQSHKQNVTQLV